MQVHIFDRVFILNHTNILSLVISLSDVMKTELNYVV